MISIARHPLNSISNIEDFRISEGSNHMFSALYLLPPWGHDEEYEHE